jgi:hypothetical protein
MFHASGGGALTSEVLRHAERGRRADFDSAHMFLARYQVDEGGERRTSRGVSSRGAPAPAVEEPAVASPEPAVPSQEVPAEAAPTKPDTTPEVIKGPQVAAAAVAAAAEPIAKVENVALFSDAIRFLRRRGDSLAKSAEELGEGSAKGLIDNCVSAVEHLADLFSEDESGCQAADAFIDELAEAQDMMVLMQVEDGDGPAADAITLLLQLRRDMEMQLAA